MTFRSLLARFVGPRYERSVDAIYQEQAVRLTSRNLALETQVRELEKNVAVGSPGTELEFAL